MELIYITHNNILNLHAIASWISWPLVIGAGYGFIRGVRDAIDAWIAFQRKQTPS